jgi:hypothetical protein
MERPLIKSRFKLALECPTKSLARITAGARLKGFRVDVARSGCNEAVS